jgi:hypothetical protein
MTMHVARLCLASAPRVSEIGAATSTLPNKARYVLGTRPFSTVPLEIRPLCHYHSNGRSLPATLPSPQLLSPAHVRSLLQQLGRRPAPVSHKVPRPPAPQVRGKATGHLSHQTLQVRLSPASEIALTISLSLLERPENQHMIRWDPAGEHIIVERPEQLALHVLPSIYRQSRFASFSRQLNVRFPALLRVRVFTPPQDLRLHAQGQSPQCRPSD